MKERHKRFLKINLFSIVLTAISFISVTLAWFAYSGLSTVETDVNIRAWNIELESNGKKASNQITISLNDLYPGMEPVSETVKINNLGDSDASVKYEIKSARILGDPNDYYELENGLLSNDIEDIISNNYPFKINLNLSKNFILSKGEETTFDLSVSWPLDSDDDEADSLWGEKAHSFEEMEESKSIKDPTYQKDSSILVKISLMAEQYIEEDNAPDTLFNLGKEYLIDVNTKSLCSKISETCLKTTVIDTNSKLSDNYVHLIPNFYGLYTSTTFDNYDNTMLNYQTTWNVEVVPLTLRTVVKIASKDVKTSYMSYPNLSSMIIGYTDKEQSLNAKIEKVKLYSGNFNYLSNSFPYLVSSQCVWTNEEYDIDNGFSLKENDNRMYVGKESKMNECKIIPVIKMLKEDIKKDL